MIENNNPEINVDDIMEKIRKEVSHCEKDEADRRSVSNGFNQNVINTTKIERIKEDLNIAQQNASIGTHLSAMNRFPAPIRWLARLMGRIVLYLTEIITFPQRTYNQIVLQAIRDNLDLSRRINEDLTQFAGDLTQFAMEKAKENEKLIGLISEGDGRLTDQLNEQDQQRVRIEKIILNLKTNLVFQEHRVNMFLEEARKRLPEAFSPEQLEKLANGYSHRLDPHYVFFEDQFRGDRNEIKERLKIYLPLLKEIEDGMSEHPILDIGCGRGEWLELLSENNLAAHGIDINQVMIEQNGGRGFDVLEADFSTYLPTLSDKSLGVVTVFHLIEHLSLDQLLLLLDESLRVLKRGGMIILETPNPENILVASTTFYLDPTHRNPLPPSLIQYLTEQRGFCRTKVLRLHPYSDAVRINDEDSETAKRFNAFFYGPQDYALIGYKV